ncbi:hypothetical protein ACC691_38370, partial [Rhizobium johnstonii]|uniref:hypothetical protein n=1 Tax=Rhizobium johnstonii TaxID=3019933 RepID=UPI003F97CC1E
MLFAFLDWRMLRAAGYERRFHWAWAFLGSLVYVIGRSVLVKRAAGRGSAPMWIAIVLYVVTSIVGIVWVFSQIAGALAPYVSGDVVPYS